VARQMGPEVKFGVTDPISLGMPTEAELALDEQLHEEMKSDAPLETEEKMRFRAEVLIELKRICQQWVQEECISQGDEDLAQRAGAKIFTFGSYRLGLISPGSDIDVLCVAPKNITRESFFQALVPKLQEHPEVTDVTPVPDAYTPIIKMKLSSVEIDLLFARLSSMTEELSWRPLPARLLRRAARGTTATDTELPLVQVYMLQNDVQEASGVHAAGAEAGTSDAEGGVAATELDSESVEAGFARLRRQVRVKLQAVAMAIDVGHGAQVRSRREQRGKEKDIWKKRLQEERQKAVQQGKLTRHVQVTGARALTRGLEVGLRKIEPRRQVETGDAGMEGACEVVCSDGQKDGLPCVRDELAAWNRSRTPLQARPQASPSADVAPTVLDGTPDSERVRRCLEREAEDALPEVVRKDLAIQPDRPLVER
ncbi:unnamed protein product, partial [Cladocopium goreaui]